MRDSDINPSRTNGIELPAIMETYQPNHDPPPPYSTTMETNNSSTIIHQTIIVQSKLKSEPTVYKCPTCNEMVLTKVKYENSRKTHMLAGFICGFTFWCMLCCLAAIPYMFSTFKKAEHYCTNCDTFLGTYSKF